MSESEASSPRDTSSAVRASSSLSRRNPSRAEAAPDIPAEIKGILNEEPCFGAAIIVHDHMGHQLRVWSCLLASTHRDSLGMPSEASVVEAYKAAE
eukprot:CAMPEP_0115152296 /NCGR_PEP_ID=MMETSP0227-20121206/66086_1 /TAXON_ID=89957 /ORGANISM="Polarella glacialis, Strain CCMP 1383" /LENGTH=95 /DNA_ID=CAMNT_0002562897 /DNA_START=175 /DNA_END=461 /DNA_ORIENTATION=-